MRSKKRSTKKSKKNLSLLEWRCFLVNDIALLKETKESKKKKQNCLLAGKLSLEKKAVLLNGVWFWVKNILSLLAGKIRFQIRFLSSKVKVFIWFLAGLCSKVQIFFFFLATLPSQNIVKEIAYISSSYQAPFKSEIFFLSFVKWKINEKNKACDSFPSILLFSFINVIYKFD